MFFVYKRNAFLLTSISVLLVVIRFNVYTVQMLLFTELVSFNL